MMDLTTPKKQYVTGCRGKILASMKDRPYWDSVTDIANAMVAEHGMTRSTFYRQWKLLKAEGALEVEKQIVARVASPKTESTP